MSQTTQGTDNVCVGAKKHSPTSEKTRYFKSKMKKAEHDKGYNSDPGSLRGLYTQNPFSFWPFVENSKVCRASYHCAGQN